MRVLNPTTAPTEARFEAAARIRSLRGARVGLLDNGKHNSNRLLEHLCDVLAEEHGFSAVRRARKPSPFAPAPEAVLAELADSCDVVITAVGD
jgi:hypothetical protein